MQRKFQNDYDYENDSLFLYREKSKGSVVVGNIVLDFNAKKELVGLELLEASKFLQSMNGSDVRISKKLLKSLIDARIDIKEDGGFLILKLFLYFENNEKLMVPVNVPNIQEHSPLTAKA